MKFLRFGFAIIVLLSLHSCFTVRNSANFSYQKLPPPEYSKMLKDSVGYYLIDVRTKGEYDNAHISTARNLSFLNFDFGKEVDSLNRNKLVFVYCQTCHRSPFAARTLKRKGFRKVYDLKGGYAKWKPEN